jgi:Capsule assembly protein Wzi
MCQVPLLGADQELKKKNVGPVYVELDSWIYPALKRLAALGYVPDTESLVLPWTRQECELLVNEADDSASRRDSRTAHGADREEALSLISTLKAEFSGEMETSRASAGIDSIYLRYLQISGKPLRDSYHFGQTLVNDFGRPYSDGLNAQAGISAFATYGRFSAYFRGEYQESGYTAPYSANVQSLLATLDGVPPRIVTRGKSSNSFDPLEMYLGAHVAGFDVTVGKQGMWWGPGEDSAFSFSDNAEPIYALRAAQSSPILLPGPLRMLGRIRTQFMFGRLTGHAYPPKPLINAQKITLQLTPDFELGFTRSAIFGGVGHPLTISSFWSSLFSTSSTGGTSFGSGSDPGDRRSGFDFSWHLPGLRRYVTIYSDSLADDEPNPLDSPRRSAWAPGMYITQLPRLPHLDLRFETYSTWLYRKDAGGLFFYWNDQYRDAYTNNGNIIGSWVGRDSRAYSASSTYWWSAQNKLTANFRQTKTGSNFIPGGGTQTDISLSVQRELWQGLLASAFVQYERYFVPVLGGPRTDVAASLQFTYYPHKRISWR